MKTVTLELNVRIDAEINETQYFAEDLFEFETGNDLDSFLDECKDELIEQICSFNEEDEDFETLEQLIKDAEYDISYEVKDWGDVEEYDNLKDIDVLQEIAEEPDLSWPYSHIDWDWAAMDLMYNYTESHNNRNNERLNTKSKGW